MWIGCVCERTFAHLCVRERKSEFCTVDYVRLSSVAPKKCSDADTAREFDWMQAQKNLQQIITLIEWKHFDHTHTHVTNEYAECHLYCLPFLFAWFLFCTSAVTLCIVHSVDLFAFNKSHAVYLCGFRWHNRCRISLSTRAIGINIIFMCTCAFHRIVWNKNNEKEKRRHNEMNVYWNVFSGNKLGLANVTEQFTIVFLLFIRSTLSTRELWIHMPSTEILLLFIFYFYFSNFYRKFINSK